ncbi:MAG TPA: alginate export family protein [bacterium]|nr:alginate export family protein [bacterium]
MKNKLWLIIMFIFTTAVFCEANFDYGLIFRLREEYLKNAWDFNNQSNVFQNDNYFRIRSSFWMKYNFGENISLYTRLTGEPDIYLHSKGTLRNMAGNYIGDNEIVIDNLYLDVKNVFNLPVDLRIGRQDFLPPYGEGFLIINGTPQDGSRTLYFNAIKTTYHFNENNSLDLIFLYNRDEDKYLPVINDLETKLINSDEKGVILYGNFKPTEKLSLQPYYIYKSEDAYTTQNGTNIPKLELNTIGVRHVYSFNPWQLRGELSYEFGEYEDDDNRNAVGGYVYLTRFFKDKKFSPSLDFGFGYLSGDNDKTKGTEGWDPLFSKFPWISELYLYAYAIEAGEPAYWTNTQLWRTALTLNLSEKTDLLIAYNYLRANENLDGTAPFFGDGKERGHLQQLILEHNFNKNVSGHLWCEYFIPGDFYSSNNQDPALFFRWEMIFKF